PRSPSYTLHLPTPLSPSPPTLPLFFFNDTAPTEIYTLSLHDALPIWTNKIVSDRMVVNAAFLVDRQNGLQFDDAVRRLSDEFNDRLMFKYFGPVPPYNFVNIAVNWEG